MVGFGEVCYRVLDATMAAIAAAVGERGIASGSGSTGTVVVAGRRERGQGEDYFTTLELSSGAYGARAGRDGIDAIRYGPGNAGHIPIEADEIENPLFFEAYEIVPGYRRRRPVPRRQRVRPRLPHRVRPRPDLPVRGPPRDAAARPVRRTPGRDGALRARPRSGRERILPSKTPYIDLAAGTLVHLQSAGGGGYGDPRERDPARIAEDLKNGYVTEAGAAAYGYTAKADR